MKVRPLPNGLVSSLLRGGTSSISFEDPPPYVVCVRGAVRREPFTPACGAPRRQRGFNVTANLSACHGATERGANTQRPRGAAAWGSEFSDAKRGGAAGGRRSAAGGGLGRGGGRRQCGRAVGTASGTRGTEARMQPLQVTAGRG